MEFFHLINQVGQSRVGVMNTAHGSVETPVFMPVGTQTAVKSLDADDMKTIGAQIILSNAYHNILRPGTDVIAELGGLQEFTQWKKPMLTDSGGFQVFSLSGGGFIRIGDDGVTFRSHLDGSEQYFTPERILEEERKLGADIIMPLDHCTPDTAPHAQALEALHRTTIWAERTLHAWEKADKQSVHAYKQHLFGIVQGGMHKDLRIQAAEEICALPFDGISVAGETVGYNMERTVELMDWIRDILPQDKPRYAMGLGRDPQNLVDAVRAGFDMFDCVAPTRLARNGALYVGQLEGEDPHTWEFVSEFPKARLNIGNTQWKTDDRPIQEGCGCHTCSHGYSRAYLRHLSLMGELTYYRLASIHNVYVMVKLAEEIRARLIAWEHKGLK
jgi:tRNA-guanine transglycosylase